MIKKTTNTSPFYWLILAVILINLSLPTPMSAQNAAPNKLDISTPKKTLTVFESLGREEVLQLRLATNLRQLLRHKAAKKYQVAQLSYQSKQGDPITQEIKLKSRGNARLQVCSLPPLQLKFPKNKQKQKNRKLKLVLSCESGDAHEQLVLREYLVYKLYNVLTDSSFRVQLAYLQLEDSERKEKTKSTYAFFIENEDEMAKRLQGTIFTPRAYRRSALMETPFDLMSLFQYVIGNTDWYVTNRHNLKLVQGSDPNQVISVPYDFDYAGIIDAPYALPHRDLPISSVIKRYFIGQCRKTGQYDKSIQLILDKKLEMLAIVENCPYLSKRSKKWMIKYLQESFEILEDPKKLEQEIAKGCGWKL